MSKGYRRSHPATDGMISLVTFLMVATTVDKNNKIDINNLGTNGLFVAIIIGLLAVEINRLIERVI